MSDNITYVIGDATQPIGGGHKIIAHICNDIGVWGKGFVMAISKRWPKVRNEYLAFSKQIHFRLGATRIHDVADDLQVASMVAQKGIKSAGNPTPIRYDALAYCLDGIARHAAEVAAAIEGPVTIHMPRIGTGLAGGEWSIIEPIIGSKTKWLDIPVVVYDLEAAA